MLLQVVPQRQVIAVAGGFPEDRLLERGPRDRQVRRVAGAFTRPGTNAQSLRYNDAVARAVLRSLPVVARASSAA